MEPVRYDDYQKAAITFSDIGAKWEGDLSSKPEIERNLFSLQEKYYKTKDDNKKKKIWSEMFILVQKYSKSLVLKKKKGKKWEAPEKIDDEATQTALSFMSQYIDRPGYHVGASFAGMINPKVIETLYKKNPNDNTYSLSNSLYDTNLELEDMQESMNFQPLYNVSYDEPGMFIDNISLKDNLNGIIKEFCKEIKDEKIKFKIMSYILILLRKPKNKHIIPMFLKYITVDKKEYDLIHLFQLELYNRLSS